MWVLDALGIPTGRYDSARLVLAHAWPNWFIGLCLVACLAAMVWTWWTVQRMRRRRARLAILFLRAATMVCALALLLEPQLQLRRSARIKNRVAVLVDVSASMSVRDQPRGTSRAEAVGEFFQRNDSWFKRLDEQFDVAYFTFGQTLTPVQRAALRDAPNAEQGITDLLGALRALEERYRGALPQAVLLLSDGADNAASLSLEEKREAIDRTLEQFKVPFYCLIPNRSRDFCDVALVEVEYEDLAFVRTEWTAFARVKATGFKGKPIPLTLTQGRSVIATHRLIPQEDVAEFRVKFTFMPIETGKVVLTVSAPVLAEEALDSNNAYHMPVRVIRDKTRVLHICGRPSWDERFLRQALKQDPNVDLVSLFILRTPTDYQAVPSSEMSLIQFPENALFEEHLREFDVVIFQNFNYKPYGLTRYLPNLRKFVLEYGGGFVMVGGDLSFSEGQYAASPLADILPVEIAAEKDQLDTTAFRPLLTEAGRRHPITALEPDSALNEAIWKSLPALAGCNKALGLRPEAMCLAAHPTLSARSSPMPIIAVMEVGKGRTAAVMTDSTWHWGLPALAEKGTTRHYFTFWRNLLRWLIKDPDLNLVRIQSDRDSYEPGEEVRLTLSVLDRSYRPAPQAPIRLKLSGPGPVVPPIKSEVTTGEAGTAEVAFAPQSPGVYVLEASASQKGTPPNLASEMILVQRAGPELREIAVQPELLAHLAQKSGGRLFELPADDFPRGATIRDPYVARVLEKEDVPLWDNWLALALLVGLLSVEWWIRKRSGLP